MFSFGNSKASGSLKTNQLWNLDAWPLFTSNVLLFTYFSMNGGTNKFKCFIRTFVTGSQWYLVCTGTNIDLVHVSDFCCSFRKKQLLMYCFTLVFELGELLVKSFLFVGKVAHWHFSQEFLVYFIQFVKWGSGR